MKKRDRRITPSRTSIAVGKSNKPQKSLFDFDCVAVPESTELKTGTSSAFYLDGEGTSGDRSISKNKEKSKDTVRIISNKDLKISKKIKISKKNVTKKNDYRVPVLYPDGKPGMPTTNKRANKWLKEGKAKILRNKLNIFVIQLKFWPAYRNLQPIAILINPGSAFTGIAVISKKCILISYMLELPGYKKGAKPTIIINRHGKKIKKYLNTIVERMSNRKRLRRSRRYRNCRRRPARFLNRSKKDKISPSMLARKQLELEMTRELAEIYPISIIGFEDVSFDHSKDKDGTKGQFFSHVEVGKNWLLNNLKKITRIRIIRGYETARRREQLKLPKEEDKTKRCVESHINDCIAIGSIILGSGINTKNKFKFDVISRPKYTRRILSAEQPNEDGITERYGGHLQSKIFKGLRKGDYVEARAPKLKKIYRGWISGYTGNRIYISDFDWNQYPNSFGLKNVRLIDRNHGLINLRLAWIKDAKDVCKYGTKQTDIEKAWG